MVRTYNEGISVSICFCYD